jgi:hypothetical protein
MQRLTAALIYFLITYAAGFAFGVVREFFVTPYAGLSLALVIEQPFMIAVCFLAARFVMERAALAVPMDGFVVGVLAFGCLLIAEDVMSRVLRGISVFTLWANFTWVAAFANYGGLAVFAALPYCVTWWKRRTQAVGLS